MPTPKHKEVRKAANNLRNKDNISLVDVLTLAEASIHSMKTFIDSLDSTIYREFREIASYIQKTKQEIGHLQAHDLKSKHIPAAGHELSIVVTTTEAATTKIMECAEEILEADNSDMKAYRELVNSKVMDIFEACSFQDLTGQRITKVIETLEYIETRVSRFASAIGTNGGDEPATEKEAKRKKRKKDQMLNGPALEGEGVSQDDIDALLNSLTRIDGLVSARRISAWPQRRPFPVSVHNRNARFTTSGASAPRWA